MAHYFTQKALLSTGWATNVRLKISANGIIEKIETEAQCSSSDVNLGQAVLLPAPSNLHSHGFQRALAGLTEFRSGAGNDSFWTWRNLMYAFLEHLTPDHMRAINAYAQMQMLEAGYASIGEFHYVHHQVGGGQYDNIAELANAVTDAASTTGIGLTLLPVYYEQGGVDGRSLSGGQLRFKNSPDSFDQLWQGANSYCTTAAKDYKLGIAPHSLRAVSPAHLTNLVETYSDGPIHIHIAEQLAEIQEIENAYGNRPVQWLMDHAEVGANWCLVHATHMDAAEIGALARSTAVAGLCPVTEANLGDGIFDALNYLSQNGRIGVGTDSNISISFAHELRLLEYSQRLHHKGRALICTDQRSTGRSLFEACLNGGAQAIGRKSGQIREGYLADFVTLNNTHPDLLDLQGDYLLDSWIFASGDNLVQDVISAGRYIVKDGAHVHKEKIQKSFEQTISKLRNLI